MRWQTKTKAQTRYASVGILVAHDEQGSESLAEHATGDGNI